MGFCIFLKHVPGLTVTHYSKKKIFYACIFLKCILSFVMDIYLVVKYCRIYFIIYKIVHVININRQK